jgi:hypothetical protein
MHLDAKFSPCRKWRYLLIRRWSNLPLLIWLLLNPSTADESRDDPTIRRCMGYAMNLGYGGIVILNLYALRSTLPGGLLLVDDPVGAENDEYLRMYALPTCQIVCGWGNWPVCRRSIAEQVGARVFAVRRLLRERGADTRALWVTSLGQPQHPLYLSSKLKPEQFSC